MTDLDKLIAAVEAGTFLMDVLPPPHETTAYDAFSGSLDAALRLHEALLPGWGWAIGECHVSDDARVFPDFHCPTHGERLRATVRENADWFDITDVDQRPPGNPARAWLLAILRALKAKGDA